jgi:KDO2-lipid IV(A) lauroyltransferase
MTLLSRLRQQTQAHCVMVVAERLPWTKGIHLHFQVLAVNEEKNKSMPIEDDVKHLNAVIESAIQCYPSQYVWGYNRYKVPAGVSAPL